MATYTTLGADNGIGVANELLAGTYNYEHGPLELLFTADEENGLYGVQKLKRNLKAKTLINLDGFSIDGLIIGCAGSESVISTYKYKLNIRNNNEYVRTLEENTPQILKARRRNDRRFGRHYRVDCNEDIDSLFFRYKLRQWKKLKNSLRHSLNFS